MGKLTDGVRESTSRAHNYLIFAFNRDGRRVVVVFKSGATGGRSVFRNSRWGHEKMCCDFSMPEKPRSLADFLTESQIAALPDQRVLRSWAFEPYLELHQDNANAAIDVLLQDLCTVWIQKLRRKPNLERQDNFVRCLRVILLNLMRAEAVRTGLTVGIPSGKDRLNKERRYRPQFMSVHYHLKALELLQEHDLVWMVKAGHQQEDYAETARYALTKAASKRLLVSSLAGKDFTIGRQDEVILMKDNEKRLTGYVDTPAIKTMRANLHELNELLEQSDIAAIRQANPLIDFDSDYRGETKSLYRIFNNGSFDQGGRFYGGWWQHAKKHLRRKITINGQPTVEADFKGLHPAILFAKNGLPIPPDPYALVPGISDNEMLRNHAKTTFLALLNAGVGGTKEPRDFDGKLHGMTKAEFQRSVRNAFPMLPGIFGTGIGLRLQREDSDMAERIMLHFKDRRVPVLTVHDSFIIESKHQDELVQLMQTVFWDAYGQIPVVTLAGD